MMMVYSREWVSRPHNGSIKEHLVIAGHLAKRDISPLSGKRFVVNSGRIIEGEKGVKDIDKDQVGHNLDG
jgi:hypothetical protein